MIEIGPNLESVLTTAFLFFGLAAIVWAFRR